jgi:hypothetical protein
VSEDTRRILEMLSEGKIKVAEAEQLIAALSAKPAAPAGGAESAESGAKPRWLRIAVHKMDNGAPRKEVNIRVPMSLIRGGVRLGAIIPGMMPGAAYEALTKHMREKGIEVDFSKSNVLAALDAAQLEDLLKDVGELNIDVDDGKEQVRIFCE